MATIIPSIDILGGTTVQLVGGDESKLKVDGGSPIPIAKQFNIAGEIAVVDLDAALGKGNNRDLILQLLPIAECRVGGGIRNVETALFWLNAGATKVVLGTAAVPDVLKQLPKERVIAALDALRGEVVIHGWQTKTGQTVFDRIDELKPYVGGFLVTFVESEGRLEGIDLDMVKKLKEAVSDDCELTVAGGITTLEDLNVLHQLGVKGQVGMALYTGVISLGDAVSVGLTSDRPDGLFPTMVVDEQNQALGLVYSNKESIALAVTEQRGIYYSRKRGIWRKGESSGATQELVKIRRDCDSDALCFVVKQTSPGFCHLNRWSCFDVETGLSKLARTLTERKAHPVEGSYTNRLFNDPELLNSKLREEVEELIEANTKEEITWEAADVIYFALVRAINEGVTLEEISAHLNLRSLKVTRRAGDAKPPKVPVVPTFSTLKKVNPDSILSQAAQAPVDPDAMKIAREIVEDISKKGEVALRSHCVRLGDIQEGEPLIWDRAEMEKQFLALPIEQQQLLQRSADRVRKFAESQRGCIKDLATPVQGGSAGHLVDAVAVAGCYAPGGRYPLPSSVLMTVITARAAGVENVFVASPRPNQLTVGAAYVAGADSILRAGGAQAIAAMAYGIEGTMPASDVIVGPGNKYVTAAKALVSGIVKIDMLAGPSEVLVIADSSADPAIVASDLIAQAEHDPDSSAILVAVAVQDSWVDSVNAELVAQLAVLSTRDIATLALVNNSYVVRVETIEEAFSISDKIGPEHLELHVDNASALKEKPRHYGGLFLGHVSAEVLGDYCAGPNHVLPTRGTARYSGGLSVFTFLRVRTWLDISATDKGAHSLVQDCASLGELEGLAGHASAAKKRLALTENSNDGSDEASVVRRYIRPDFESIPPYTPIKPLEVVAAEVGLKVEDLVKIDANENTYGPVEGIKQAISNYAHNNIYPDPGQAELREAIAKEFKVTSDMVVAGTGADDLLQLFVTLSQGRAIVSSEPTFGMYSFLASIADRKYVNVPRNEDFKVDVSALITSCQYHNASLLFLSNPNNPTGDILSREEVARIATALEPFCLFVLDEAYAEFANISCIDMIKDHPNLIIMRTFSKWAALAGLRVGFSISHPSLAAYIDKIKQPYNVSSVADAAARAALANRELIMTTQVAAIITERERLYNELGKFSWLKPHPNSQANFILCKTTGISAFLLAAKLRKEGVLIRYYSNSRLSHYLRFSVGRPQETDALIKVLQNIDQDITLLGKEYLGQVEAVLWDMDGVLADVSGSYRKAIISTAAHWGVQITMEDIETIKAKGDANNDWVVSMRLIHEHSTQRPTLAEVTEKFEELYQGTESQPGLCATETLIPSHELLQDLLSKYPKMGIVTGRPIKDAKKFLTAFQLDKYFSVVVAMEDTPKPKPDPAPVKLAMSKLGVKTAVLIGDTPDDLNASTLAKIGSIGALVGKGAATPKALAGLHNANPLTVLTDLEQLRELLL
eukprot:TRINITY_DN1626_c0_g1_i1.p1 TRINITY_DN1626_c0_g1~~TRINITY_DN1626_c0_g1_i1.p1  ORF type:complete len:1471 (-),score=377.24 TRINITY_DN1626_c0_g1_i1:62-4474(-)